MRITKRYLPLAVAVCLVVAPLSVSIAADDARTTEIDAMSPPPVAAPADAGVVMPDAAVVPNASSSDLPASSEDPEGLAKDLYRGITTKNWFLVAGSALALLTLGARSLLKKKWAVWQKDRWGVALAAGMAALTTLSIAWAADAPLASSNTWMGALKLLASSVFTYVTTKKILNPADAAQ